MIFPYRHARRWERLDGVRGIGDGGIDISVLSDRSRVIGLAGDRLGMRGMRRPFGETAKGGGGERRCSLQ